METPAPQLGCVKAATEVLGDKWTPKLLRFFINNQVVRFCQLQDLAEDINPRTLSARLSNLEQGGVIERRIAGPGSRCEYRLTQKGQDLLPTLRDMQAWSKKYTHNAN